MNRKLHSPRMAPARQILALLALVGAAFFLLACGSSDEPTLEGEPFSTQESDDLTKNLDDLEAAFNQGDCEEAQNKLAGLQEAVELMPEERDAELRDALTSALDDLGGQIDTECTEADDTSTSTTQSTSSAVPTTSSTTPSTSSTTSTSSSEEEPPTTPEEPPEPPGPPDTPPGQDGTPPGQDDGSGGTAPGGGFEADG